MGQQHAQKQLASCTKVGLDLLHLPVVTRVDGAGGGTFLVRLQSLCEWTSPLPRGQPSREVSYLD